MSPDSFRLRNKPAELLIRFASTDSFRVSKSRHHGLKGMAETAGIFTETPQGTFLRLSSRAGRMPIHLLTVLVPFESRGKHHVPRISLELEAAEGRISADLLVDGHARRLTWAAKDGKNLLDSVI
jgi:hypothetical protein